MHTHDPNFPDVDPVTGDEAETEEFITAEFDTKKNLQDERVDICRWRDLMME